MKSIKRIRLSLVTAFSAAAIALTAVGLNMRPVSVKAENSVVNGWNSAVARGDQTVELGIAAEDNFASFSDLQSGDVISYAGRYTLEQDAAWARTLPLRMSISAKGTGSVTWQFLDGDLAKLDEFAFQGIYYTGKMTLGGNALEGAGKWGGNLMTNIKPKTIQSGETLDLAFNGFSPYGSSIYYVDEEGVFTEAATLAGGFYTATSTDFAISVKVEGEITDLSVKIGEGLYMTSVDKNFAWPDYHAPFKAVNDAEYRGVLKTNSVTNLLDYFVFKGYPMSLTFDSDDADAIADIKMGGNRIGGGKAGERYAYTVPVEANAANLEIREGVNGWSPTVKRGDQQVKADVTMTDDYYASFTGLQSGDVISYNGTLKSEWLKGPMLRTMPYALSIIPTGTGTVSWDLQAAGMAAPLRITMVVGGDKALRSQYGTGDSIKDIKSNKTCASGETLTVVVDGHHIYDNTVFYLNEDGTFENAAQLVSSVLFADGELLYDTFNVSVTVSGEITGLKLKLGESMMFTKLGQIFSGTNWTFEGYSAPFNANFGAETSDTGFRGIYKPVQAGDHGSEVRYFAFRGFPLSLKCTSTDPDAAPYVTIGGQKVNSDNTAPEGQFGWYNYTVSPYATDAAVSITASDLNVTYMDGDEVFKKVAVGFNETTSPLANVEKKGNVAEGFYADADLTTPFDFASLITQNTNIYIKWKEVPHLTFMVDDQVYGYQNFETAGLPDMPEDPSKEGKGFMGWYADANGTTKFDFSAQITENATAYAVFGYNVAYQISGFTGENQKNVKIVKEGGAIAAAEAPSYAEVTGGLEFDAFVLEWYKDAELTQKVTFPYTPSASGALYGRLVDTKDYVKPNEYGWDTQKGVKNQDTVVGDKEIPLTESEYGMAAKAIGQGDGYSKFQLGYEGYVVNANKLNVAKEIYFDIEVDSACDTDWAQSGGAAKWISFGLFNSLNGALTSQGPETNRGLNGGLALFAFNLTENTTQISGWPTGNNPVRPVANAFTYNATVKLDMMHFVIVIGETKAESGLYLEKDGNRTLIANLDLQRSMFPDGAYLMLSCFRKTDFTVRLAQQSSIKAGSQENGTYSFSKTSGIAGEKVYIENIAPKAGYKFTERSVFAGDTALSLETEEVGGEVKYYFSMPVGDEVVIEIKWAVAVTFVADDQTLGTAYVVPGDKVLGVDMPDDPEKAGHTFDGWYKDAAFTQAFDRKTDAIEGLTTIYAKFTANVYTITFMSDNETYKTGTANYGGKFTSEEISREGYTFGGWFTDEACTQAYDFETAVTGNLTVYAKWTPVGGGTSSETENSSSGNGQSSSEAVAGCKAGCGSAAGIGGLIAGMTLAGVAILSAFKKKSK